MSIWLFYWYTGYLCLGSSCLCNKLNVVRLCVVALFSYDKWCSSHVVSSRFYRVLTMVCNTQNYWVFGLCPSSGF
jgi:hypothetical protein